MKESNNSTIYVIMDKTIVPDYCIKENKNLESRAFPEISLEN